MIYKIFTICIVVLLLFFISSSYFYYDKYKKDKEIEMISQEVGEFPANAIISRTKNSNLGGMTIEISFELDEDSFKKWLLNSPMLESHKHNFRLLEEGADFKELIVASGDRPIFEHSIKELNEGNNSILLFQKYQPNGNCELFIQYTEYP